MEQERDLRIRELFYYPSKKKIEELENNSIITQEFLRRMVGASSFLTTKDFLLMCNRSSFLAVRNDGSPTIIICY